MRKTRVFLALLFILCSVLSGCGRDADRIGSGEEGGTKNASEGDADGTQEGGLTGRFLETKPSFPVEVDRIYAMGELADGSVVLLADAAAEECGYLLCTADAGDSFTVQKTAGSLETIWVTAAAIAPDGSAVLAGQFSDGAETFTAKRVAPDGTIAEQPLRLPDANGHGSENYVRYMKFDAEGRLFVQDAQDAVLAVDVATGECRKAAPYTEESVSYFDIAGEKLLLVSEECGLSVWQTSDGTQLAADEALKEAVGGYLRGSAAEGALPVVFSSGVEDGSIVYANAEGVFYHMDGGSTDEQLVDSALTWLASMQGSLHGIVMPQEDTFLIFAEGSEGSEILRYRYDASASASPETELTIYALEESDQLRKAAMRFQSEHPGIYVNLQIGVTGTDGVTVEDAVAALNTEILAGNVPDILILDGLPAESYVEKGVLADISGIVDGIAQTDGLFDGIADNYRKDGACYMMPAQYYMTLASGSAKAVESAVSFPGYVDCILQMKEEAPGRNILQRRPPSELLWALYYADSGNWRNADGTVNGERVGEWLQWAKQLYDVDGYSVDEEQGAYHVYEGMLVSTVDAEYKLMGESSESVGSLTNMFNLASLYAIYAQTGDTCALFGSDEAHCFVPYLIVGMSSTTAAQDAAEEFLELLYGSESGDIHGSGFPINRAAWEAAAEDTLQQFGDQAAEDKGISMGVSGPDGKHVGYDLVHLSQEDVDSFRAICESLDTPAVTDATIRELAIAQGLRYLTGEATLEQAKGELLQQLNLYFAE